MSLQLLHSVSLKTINKWMMFRSTESTNCTWGFLIYGSWIRLLCQQDTGKQIIEAVFGELLDSIMGFHKIIMLFNSSGTVITGAASKFYEVPQKSFSYCLAY